MGFFFYLDAFFLTQTVVIVVIDGKDHANFMTGIMYVNISISKDYMSTPILEYITYVFVCVCVTKHAWKSYDYSQWY